MTPPTTAPAPSPSDARSARSDSDAMRGRFGAGSATVGGTLLATCLCGTPQIVFGVAAGTSMTALYFGPNMYTGLMALAVGLIVVGLAVRSRRAGVQALAGALTLGAGYALAPPGVMHAADHTAANFIGFGLTLAGIGGLVWAFMTAFPTRDRGSAGWAAGGFGAAAGCSCCLASGALVWIAAAFGFTVPGAPFADGIPFVLFTGVAAFGLWRLAGPRYALLALGGAALALGGDEVLKPLLADEIERLPRLLVALAGTGIIMLAFVQAFGATRPPEPAERVGAPGPNAGPGAHPSRPTPETEPSEAGGQTARSHDAEPVAP